MGPREAALRAEAEQCFAPDAAEYFCDPLARVGLERRQILDALEEALNGWEYAAGYKGEFLMKKHGDAEDIARLRKVLSNAGE